MINQDIQQLANLISEQINLQINAYSRWLNLKQAAIYSNIGQKKLIELAQKNEVNGFQDIALKTTPWIFDKESIDFYRLKQFHQKSKDNIDDERIALEIVSSWG